MQCLIIQPLWKMQLFAWSNDAWNIHTCSHLAVYFTLANSNGLFTPLYCRYVWCVAVIHWEKYPKAPSQCTCIAGHCIALTCIVVCGTHKLKGEVWAFKKHTYILASMLYICVMLQLSHVKMENWPLITHCHCQSRSLLCSSNAHWNDRLERGKGQLALGLSRTLKGEASCQSGSEVDPHNIVWILP